MKKRLKLRMTKNQANKKLRKPNQKNKRKWFECKEKGMSENKERQMK